LSIHETVPYTLTRLRVVMAPDPSDPREADGVLNPASGRDRDGRLYLLPRIVAAGNKSRVGLGEVVIERGEPVGIRREGVVLEPDTGWEQSAVHGGVEDPRITWVPSLGVHLMTYVAYGPLGPRPALAVSEDLRDWKRLGPLHFEYVSELNADLNLYPNKDVVYFPDPVPGPSGEPCYAALHRPMWDLGLISPGAGSPLPAGLSDDRPGIWISYVPVSDVQTRGFSALAHLGGHRLVALCAYAFEAHKIGAGPPPIRINEGWLLIHHGVSGELIPGVELQPNAHYAAGAMILSADDPSSVLARTAQPLLSPVTEDERQGVVPNVVFPTAIEQIEDRMFVFYGMADTKIGVAELRRMGES
jgi:predicted GH43/DUF377 family glycosyl hydrolase